VSGEPVAYAAYSRRSSADADGSRYMATGVGWYIAQLGPSGEEADVGSFIEWDD
jgi:hypothetical protein